MGWLASPAVGAVNLLVLFWSRIIRDVNCYRLRREIYRCSALLLILPGQRQVNESGNENDAVNTNPPEPIQDHPDIQGVGDLTVTDHARSGPVAKITITHVADDAIKFLASLSGAGEVPPPVLTTNAWGTADFTLNDDMTELNYRLKALKIGSGSTQAAIHRGLPDDNGPVVAFLYGPASPAGDERLNINGRLTQSDLAGPLAGDFVGFVAALRAGELYVNINSNAYPAGEIRGQVGAK